MLKPGPMIVSCEMTTAAVPVLVSVTVWEALDPVGTFPKLSTVALAVSVPDEPVLLLLAAGAAVNPVHPETDRAAKMAKTQISRMFGLR
jgi:hypothetical protein